MQRVGKEITIKYELSFTAEEVELLGQCARRHYDAKCKAANTTGFINGLRNVMESGVATWVFDFRTLDLACKITEVCFFSNEPAAYALHYALKKQLEDLRVEK